MAADVPKPRSRGPGRLARVLVAGWLVILLPSGCTGAAPAGQESAGQESASPAPVSAPATPSASADLPAAPTRVPAASSGPLQPGILPATSELGPGWTPLIEGTDPEEGVGNETAYQERDPAEIVQTTVPMGCEARSASPAPSYVLQATYLHRATGAYAVALRMRFADESAARTFAEVRRKDLESCRVQPDDPYSGAPAPVLDVSGGDDRHVTVYRLVGEDATWVGALHRMGADVLSLDSDAAPTDLVDWAGLGLRPPEM